MSLDKWLKDEEEEGEESKEKESDKPKDETSTESQQKTLIPEQKKGETVKKTQNKVSGRPKLTKYLLSCSNSKCKYKKTLMKRELTGKDKICPRCKSEMNVKET
jgi:hypothetical protein